jgi:hypothetical protein
MDWRELSTASRRAMLTAYGRAAYILAAIAIPGITVNIIKQFVGTRAPAPGGRIRRLRIFALSSSVPCFKASRPAMRRPRVRSR